MKKIIDFFKDLYETGAYFTFAIYLLLSVIIVFAISFFLLILTTEFMSFLASNFETIVIGVGLYVFLYFMIKEYWSAKRSERMQQDLFEQQLTEEELLNQLKSEKALLESNYYIVRTCLYTLVSELGATLHLVKPQSPSELDSPSKIITKSNITMYQFLILKSGDIDSDAIKEVFQTRITQKLLASELSISQKNYIYDGKAYPILCIDTVQDIGQYIQIDIAWASDRYCEMLKLRQLSLLENQSASISFRDGDF